jgi:hypothetical protein
MDTPPPKDQPGSFVLITHNTAVDLNDFFALTGVDSTRIVRHVIFMAIHGYTTLLREHSMMVSGQFDQARIYKSAIDGGAQVFKYRGIPVLEIQPFARESADFHDDRWFAILDSNLLLFGSVAAVQQELNRYLDGSATDPVLTGKLARLRHDDETWCLISSISQYPEIGRAMESLNPKLAKLIGDANAFQFGIRYRKEVEMEYEITTASATGSHPISDSLKQAIAGSGRGSSLLTPASTSGGENTARGVIKFPLTQFADWLNKAAGPKANKAPY